MKIKALLATILFVLVLATVNGCAGDQEPVTSPPATNDQQLATSPQPLNATSQPPIGLWRASMPAAALETQRLLATADSPKRDLVDLIARFSDPDQPIPRVAREEPWGFEIGDQHDFWVQDKEHNNYHQVLATLVYQTPHAYWYVEDGLGMGARDVHNAAERFEVDIYPTNRRFFGREWTPGVDGDPRLVILLTGDLGGDVSAYQNSLDEYARSVFPYSNEMEMITVSAEAADLEHQAFDCTLAHEFQHVIQWAVDRDEETWLNEIFGLLACPLNDVTADYGDYIVDAFASQPDIQLNAWGTDPDQVAAQYGASQLFGVYLLERLGEEAVQRLAAEPANGLQALDKVLATMGTGLEGNDLFADWVVANYLDDPSPPDGGPGGRYGYRDLDLPPIQPQRVIDAGSLPVAIEAAVGQYAADYIVLKGPGEFQVDFDGQTLVRPVPAEPYSGSMVWWGGREQESDATLSRDFDLTGLEKATLTFYTWYDIEAGYDYAYVAVSTDGWRWTALSGQTTSAGNPNGINLGPGYSGRSGGWIQERIDLTAYAGQKVQVRFEYVTDDGPLRPGFLLDDIEIPELGYRHDAESGDGGWRAGGFLRQANVLPQSWLLQLIIQRGGRTMVERLKLDPDNSGRWTVDLGAGETAALAISGMTRDTAEAADYWLRIIRSGLPSVD